MHEDEEEDASDQQKSKDVLEHNVKCEKKLLDGSMARLFVTISFNNEAM